MRVNFEADDSAAAKLNGYLSGVAEGVSSKKYINAATDYAYVTLKDRFEAAVDITARSNPLKFHHVYEWGDEYGDYSTVGVPQMRLWELVSTGTGKQRSVSYRLLPSVRPVPIEPELLEPGKTGKVVKEGVHIFTWKAVVMEYGQTVHITPKLRQVKAMAFVDDATGKLKFTSRPIVTVPGKDEGNAGAFTSLTYAWWSTQAPAIYDNEIVPILQAKLVPRIQGRFAEWNAAVRSKRASLSGAARNLNTMDYEKGKKQALKDMKDQAIDYVARAQKRRDDLYGD